MPRQHRAPGEVRQGVEGGQEARHRQPRPAEHEAAFVVGPRFRHASRPQQCDRAVEADLRVLRRGRDGAVVHVEACVEPTLDLQRHAEIGPGGGVLRVELARLAERRDRAFHVAEVDQRHAVEVVRRREPRIALPHPPQHRGGGGGLVGVHQEVGIGVSEPWVARRQRAAGAEGGGDQFRRVRTQARKVAAWVREIRAGGCHALQQRRRQRHVAARRRREALKQARLGIRGIMRGPRARLPLSLLEPSGLEGRQGAGEQRTAQLAEPGGVAHAASRCLS